jgi:hypothetical protein
LLLLRIADLDDDVITGVDFAGDFDDTNEAA